MLPRYWPALLSSKFSLISQKTLYCNWRPPNQPFAKTWRDDCSATPNSIWSYHLNPNEHASHWHSFLVLANVAALLPIARSFKGKIWKQFSTSCGSLVKKCLSRLEWSWVRYSILVVYCLHGPLTLPSQNLFTHSREKLQNLNLNTQARRALTVDRYGSVGHGPTTDLNFRKPAYAHLLRAGTSTILTLHSNSNSYPDIL